MLYGYRKFHFIHKNKWYLKDITEDVETRFDTSNYELERPLPKTKHKKGVGLMKVELDGEIMIEFVGSRATTYSSLVDDVSEGKKQKAQKSVS